MTGVWAAVSGWWRAVRAPSTGRHRKLPQPAPVVSARGSAEPSSRLDEERTTYIPAWTDRKWWWSR